MPNEEVTLLGREFENGTDLSGDQLAAPVDRPSHVR